MSIREALAKNRRAYRALTGQAGEEPPTALRGEPLEMGGEPLGGSIPAEALPLGREWQGASQPEVEGEPAAGRAYSLDTPPPLEGARPAGGANRALSLTAVEAVGYPGVPGPQPMGRESLLEELQRQWEGEARRYSQLLREEE